MVSSTENHVSGEKRQSGQNMKVELPLFFLERFARKIFPEEFYEKFASSPTGRKRRQLDYAPGNFTPLLRISVRARGRESPCVRAARVYACVYPGGRGRGRERAGGEGGAHRVVGRVGEGRPCPWHCRSIRIVRAVQNGAEPI